MTNDNDIDLQAQEPWIYRSHHIPHYYGDVVRQLLLFVAAVMLVGAPFYASNLATELPVIVGASLIIVCLAAFTSPVSRTILLADAVVAGVGMVLFEMWALSDVAATVPVAIALRQAIALILMFGLYFAGKTLRGTAEPDWDEQQSREEETEGEGDLRERHAYDPDADDSVRSSDEFELDGPTMRESFMDKDND